MILERLAAHAARRPWAQAVLAPGRRALGFRALHDQCLAAGTALNAGGIGRGDRVVLLLDNGPQAAAAFLGVAGHAVALPLDPRLAPGELHAAVAEAGATAVVSDTAHRGAAHALAGALGLVAFALETPPGDPAGAFTLAGAPSAIPAAPGPAASGDDALLLRTSGTTGGAKLVPLTHANLLANVDPTVAMMAMGEDDCGLCLASYFHKQGLVTGLLAPLVAGGRVVYPPAFSVATFFDWLEAFDPTWYIASPAVHRAILEEAQGRGTAPGRARLRFIRSGAAALPPALMAGLEGVFGAPVIEAYGMSEAGISCNPLPPARRKPGTVGLPFADLAIMGEGDVPLPPGRTGEIAVRGPSVARGYANDAAETAARFRGGWFFTGDLGRMDADGYLAVTGRRKEIVNRGGRKVDPAEVEALLLAHPDVREAAAFPVPHPTLGDDLAAAVVLAPGAAATPQDLRAHLFSRCAGFKVPSRIVPVEAIPTNTGGKVERLRLAGHLAERLRAPYAEPGSRLEAEIARAFAEVLEVEEVGARDDFYALGGDSLKLLELILRLEGRLRRRVSEDIAMTELTPAALAAHLTAPRADDAGGAVALPRAPRLQVYRPAGELRGRGGTLASRLGRRLGRLSARRAAGAFARFDLVGSHQAGREVPLFWCTQTWAEYDTLCRALGPGRPFYGFFSGFPLGRGESWRRKLAARQVARIAALAAGGPVLLGGNCAGAFVAFETARALEARGIAVAKLFLMEATILRPHPGDVVLLHGRDSLAYNPVLAGRDLRVAWAGCYGQYAVEEIPGNHAEFFEPRHIDGLVAALRRHYPPAGAARGEGAGIPPGPAVGD